MQLAALDSGESEVLCQIIDEEGAEDQLRHIGVENRKIFACGQMEVWSKGIVSGVSGEGTGVSMGADRGREREVGVVHGM